jgi:hypothetical protein
MWTDHPFQASYGEVSREEIAQSDFEMDTSLLESLLPTFAAVWELLEVVRVLHPKIYLQC